MQMVVGGLCGDLGVGGQCFVVLCVGGGNVQQYFVVVDKDLQQLVFVVKCFCGQIVVDLDLWIFQWLQMKVFGVDYQVVIGGDFLWLQGGFWQDVCFVYEFSDKVGVGVVIDFIGGVDLLDVIGIYYGDVV